MASHKTINKMLKAIDYCCAAYPTLPEIIENNKLTDNIIYEIMARFNVSKRTAKDYLMTASKKLLILDEKVREAEKILNEEQK